MRLLMLAAMVAASAAADYDFGLYDFQADPGDGWQLMSVEDFSNHADAFREHYGYGYRQVWGSYSCTLASCTYGVCILCTCIAPVSSKRLCLSEYTHTTLLYR